LCLCCSGWSLQACAVFLKWARERSEPLSEATAERKRANKCPWNKDTCALAAHGGHLDILKWARANKCPWDEMTCVEAANGGYYKLALYF